MNARKNERGQAVVLSVLALVALLGMSALVLDVGNWFRTQRRLQATADAAALAGAQQLPNPGLATSMALAYAKDNGGDVLGTDITVTSTFNTNDTISVKAAKTEDGVFSKVLGIDTANIDASAKARTDTPLRVRYVAPMVVSCDHPLIKKCNGNPGTSEEADWILHGFDQYLDVNKDYRSDPGAKFSSSNIQDALEERMIEGTALLFPVFETLSGTGQNANYYIIGWIGFHLESYEIQGNNAILHGYFTEFIANGILSSSGSGSPNFGVKSIQLIG